MLHEGAQTCFILQNLTKFIQVNFSIRQGDPLSMILFIIYIEPLLLYLEKNLSGLKVASITQSVESYCDDVNIITEDLLDLPRIDTAVRKFEAMSGAILSRNYKCKVLGIGSWKGKQDWPLSYLKTETEVKIFGIFFRHNYRAIVKRNWDYRLQKFSNCLHSWSSRRMPSLSSKIEVLKIFALTRVYYVASVLPVPKHIIAKFESSIGKFIWRGWLLRVSINDLKNTVSRGGLNLVCLQTMCNSLLLSQFLRLLRSADSKAIAHVVYWIGDSMCYLLPRIDTTLCSDIIPEYFAYIENLVVDGRVDGVISALDWEKVTNQMLYKVKQGNFNRTKVEVDAGKSYARVWTMLSSPVLSSPMKDIVYLLVHNKLPVRERLFRIGISNDPYCLTCPDAPVCDMLHFFCSCVKVSALWSWIKTIVSELLEEVLLDTTLINFFIPKCNKEKEVAWLLGSYIEKVWNDVTYQGMNAAKIDEFFGYLKFKYRMDQLGSRCSLDINAFK